METRRAVPNLMWSLGSQTFEIPIIDITNPCFRVNDDTETKAALERSYVVEEQQQTKTLRLLRTIMLKLGARQSRLLQGMVDTSGEYLGGLHTYLMKLGPDNLPVGFDTSIDKRVAATPHVTFMRLRLQQCARLLADGLKEPLLRSYSAPLHLLNLAGGPAIDTLNSLILLKQETPALLNREIEISVLDIDTVGPAFGAKALSVLVQEGQPLSGLNVRFSHHSYDWNDSQLLAEMMTQSVSRRAILAASSEGGLFEYGSDAAIVSNLAALSTNGAGAKLVVGSVTCADPLRRASIERAHYKLVPRGVEGFTPLAKQSGYEVTTIEHTPLSDQIALRPRC